MKGNVKVVTYVSNGKGGWNPVDERIDEDVELDYNHWKSWAELDKALGAKTRYTPRATYGNSNLHRYSTVSPDESEKVVYQYTNEPTLRQRAKQLPPTVKWNNKLKPEGY